MTDAAASPLIQKLQRLCELKPEDRAFLEQVPFRIAKFSERQDIARQGERPTDSNLLIDGLVYRHKDLRDGRRQILAFHLPGDIFDLQNFLLDEMDHSVSCQTPVTIAAIAHEVIVEITENQPRLARALWKDTLVDAAIFREWITNIGRRDATARLAHLICELFVREKSIGKASGDTMWWPLTQSVLGEALGVSPVHTNRCLTELRDDGHIELAKDRLRIVNWDRLVDLCEFNPAYLQLAV